MNARTEELVPIENLQTGDVFLKLVTLTFGGLLKDVSQQSAHTAGLAKGLLARTRSISA
jgi:hypothetical protein